jgi:hypothetical protein
VKGRWAAGIVPRNFYWVIKDRLAISERPGGYAPNHRRVRRQEEILWLRAQGFTRIVSLLPSTHNLHSYEELGLAAAHHPMSPSGEPREVVCALYPALDTWLAVGERVLVHREELGDRVIGVAAGYLRWSGLLPEGPRAITALEQIVGHQMGTEGRSIVALVDELDPPTRARPAATGEAGPVPAPTSAPTASTEAAAKPSNARAARQTAPAAVASAGRMARDVPAAGKATGGAVKAAGNVRTAGAVKAAGDVKAAGEVKRGEVKGKADAKAKTRANAVVSANATAKPTAGANAKAKPNAGANAKAKPSVVVSAKAKPTAVANAKAKPSAVVSAKARPSAAVKATRPDAKSKKASPTRRQASPAAAKKAVRAKATG